MPQSTRACIEREGTAVFSVNSTATAVGPQVGPLTKCPPISLNQTMLQIPCARLPYATVRYESNKTATWNNESGRWNLDKLRFISTPRSTGLHWKLLCAPGLDVPASGNFMHFFKDQLAKTGVCNFNNVRHIGSEQMLSNLSYTTLETALQTLHSAPAQKPDIVVLLLRSKDQNVYSHFKYLTDKVFCFQSICATESNFKPSDKPFGKGKNQVSGWQNEVPMRQYMANVAMKANLKFRGINHTADGVKGWLANTLIIGADLTHAGNGAIDNCPSIAAVVSSTEANGGHFMGQMFLQEKNDMVSNFIKPVANAIGWWKQSNDGRWPTNVLYYRDGVAESQYDELIREEVSAIEQAWNRCVPKGTHIPELKLTTVICTKRHSTRFFPASKDDAMRNNENCKPGLLVETAVTHPYFSDFYLQTQNAIKGTARPCHYFVLNNGMNISMKDLQDLTHNLCHTYVRATMVVSYAPPAYYADRLCERGRCYLRKWYSPTNHFRDEWDAKKDKIRADVRDERKAKNKSKNAKEDGTQDKDNGKEAKEDEGKKKKRKKKSRAELDQEDKDRDEDREEVDRRMRAEVWRECMDHWDKAPIDQTALERQKRNKATMYWM